MIAALSTTIPPSLIAGFFLGLSLIMAIGAQNAFVLRQGLRRQHVFWICLTCAGSDALLIAAGVLGFGSLAGAVPWFETVMRLGGAAFLIWYGARSLRSAWQGGAQLDSAAEEGRVVALLPVMATVLALTWLNPHVYLDTVVLLGSISAQYPDPASVRGRWGRGELYVLLQPRLWRCGARPGVCPDRARGRCWMLWSGSPCGPSPQNSC